MRAVKIWDCEIVKIDYCSSEIFMLRTVLYYIPLVPAVGRDLQAC